jgi:hypothetical protein
MPQTKNPTWKKKKYSYTYLDDKENNMLAPKERNLEKK